VAPVRFSAQVKSRLGFALLAAVNTGRLRLYAQDGSQEARQAWRELEEAQALYRPDRTMDSFARGGDDFLVSLALAVERPKGWRGPGWPAGLRP